MVPPPTLQGCKYLDGVLVRLPEVSFFVVFFEIAYIICFWHEWVDVFFHQGKAKANLRNPVFYSLQDNMSCFCSPVLGALLSHTNDRGNKNNIGIGVIISISIKYAPGSVHARTSALHEPSFPAHLSAQSP